MTIMELRYADAIKKIGGAPGLLSLPKSVKDVLKSNCDLKTKTEMLEMVANAKRGD